MPVGMVFLILIIVVVVIAVIIGLLSYFGSSSNRLNSSQKRELKESRVLIKNLEVLARQNKDVYPEFWQVIDMIDQSTYKELTP